jgi:hypothetical protein
MCSTTWTTSLAFLFLFFNYHIIIVVLGVHCRIYRISYNISHLNSPIPSVSIISPSPHSWSSFNMSHFSIFIHEYIIFPLHSLSYTLSFKIGFTFLPGLAFDGEPTFTSWVASITGMYHNTQHVCWDTMSSTSVTTHLEPQSSSLHHLSSCNYRYRTLWWTLDSIF